MSGHSRWSQIKHKKAITDQKKGRIFGKLAKAISIAARGNPDPRTNMRLKSAIESARAVNMPGDNIDRAVKKVSEKAGADLQEIQVEAMGPGNVAVIVTAITDNKNRTITELKIILAEHNARMASEGSLLWMFRKSGVIRMSIGELSQDQESGLELRCIEAGAGDIRKDDGVLYVYTGQDDLESVKSRLSQGGVSFLSAGLELVPSSPVEIRDEDVLEKLDNLFESLDENEDVQDIFSNLS